MKKVMLLLAASILACSSFAQVPAWLPANGLIGWWPLSGNGNDLSGNGNHGTVNNVVSTTDRNNIANSAYQFNGSSSHIIGSASTFPTVARTVSLWFYGTDIGAGTRGRSLWGYGGGICGTSYLMYLDMPFAPNSYETTGHCDANPVTYNYGANHPNNAWHHWLISSNTSGTKVYVDGQLVTSSAIYSSNTIVAGKDFIIGCVPMVSGVGNSFGDGNHQPFTGKLDDIALYDRALLPCEVTQIFRAKAVVAVPPSNQTVASSSPVTFTASATDTCLSFQWQQSTGAAFTNLSNTGIYSGVTTSSLTINPVSSAMNNYRYRCIISSCLYCTDTTTDAKLTVGSTGITENELNDKIQLFPNPLTEQLIIRSELAEPLELRILDVTSRCVVSLSFSMTVSLPTGQFARGIYIYELRSKSGAVKKGKLVKN